MAMPDTYPIQKLIREYRIGGDGTMPPLQDGPIPTILSLNTKSASFTFSLNDSVKMTKTKTQIREAK
jgi:hypothetical protein